MKKAKMPNMVAMQSNTKSAGPGRPRKFPRGSSRYVFNAPPDLSRALNRVYEHLGIEASDFVRTRLRDALKREGLLEA